MEVRILGTVGEAPPFELALVHRLLASAPVTLSHGQAFTGRPDTIVHADARHVLKLHPADQEPAARERLRRERRLGVHHPRKTWFLVEEAGEPCWQGNITPRLMPLHQQTDPDRLAPLLEAALCMTLEVLAQHGLQLDFAPSNFATDDQDRLYYLDDDLYPEDEELLSLSSALGNLLRQRALKPSGFRTLGRCLSRFGTRQDGPASDILQLRFRGLFLPREDQQAARSALLEGLSDGPGTEHERPEERKKPSSAPAALTGAAPKRLLISDIHANLPALEAILDACDRIRPDEVLVMGDIVGYGPHPAECVALLAGHDWRILRGNHDHATAHGLPEIGFSGLARWVIEWTRAELCQASLDWLAALPSRIVEDEWLAVHGAPMDRSDFNAYVYHLTYGDNLDWMQRHGQRLCFHGHTHVPSVHLRHHGNDHALVGEALSLPATGHALICPGSVGQNRSGGPLAWYALLQGNALEFTALEYDWKRTCRDMKRLGFPDALIQRIQKGN